MSVPGSSAGTSAERGPGEILVVSRREVEALLTPAACLQRCLDTFAWVGAGQVDQTNPVNLWVHDRTAPGPEPPFGYGVVQAFPALIRPLERAAVKWLSSWSKNPRRSLPAISALDLVTDTDTGMPLALVDGTSVTNMRTGGHAAVGAKFLARPDSSHLAIIGCGNEGRTHLWLLAELFALSHVTAFDIDEAAAARFAAEAVERLGVEASVASSVEAAVAEADIVCVVTTALRPVLMEPWIPAGRPRLCRHRLPRRGRGVRPRLRQVGRGGLRPRPGMDHRRRGGSHRRPRARTALRADIHADIATDIMQGHRSGREHPGERTIMTHMGMPALDAAVASLVYDLALDAGAGTWIEVF